MGRSTFNQVPTSSNLVTVFCKFCKLGARAKCYIFSSPRSLLFRCYNTIVIVSSLLPTSHIYRHSQNHLPFKDRHAPRTHSGGDFIIAHMLLLCLTYQQPSLYFSPLSELHHLCRECLPSGMDCWRTDQKDPVKMQRCYELPTIFRTKYLSSKSEAEVNFRINDMHAVGGCLSCVDLPPLYYFLCQWSQ